VLARRLLIVLAVLIGLTALAAGVTPRQPVVREDGSRPAPDAEAPPSIERTLDAAETDQRVRVSVGQTVVLIVESATLDTVSLAEYGNEPVEPDSPARFELLADVPGGYAIELLESGRRIGTLEVRPAPEEPADPGEPGGAPA